MPKPSNPEKKSTASCTELRKAECQATQNCVWIVGKGCRKNAEAILENANKKANAVRHDGHAKPHPKATGKNAKPKFANQVIVFSGFRDKELEAYIVKHGGEVKSSLSKKVSLLVYDRYGKPGSKRGDAQSMGIRQMELRTFLHDYSIPFTP